jgi:hypothetical protein
MQQGFRQYSITYGNSTGVVFEISFPTNTGSPDRFAISVRARHVTGTPPATQVRLMFSPSPSGSVRVDAAAAVLVLGDLGPAEPERGGNMVFIVSPNLPDGSTLQIRLDVDCQQDPNWRNLSPDLTVTVAGSSWLPMAVLISAIGILAIIAIVYFTKPKAKLAVAPKPLIYTPPFPPKPPGGFVGHKPSIVEERQKKRE